MLYGSPQHACEWITPEVTRRLMHHVLDGYGTDEEITRIVDTTELWFLPLASPDGYDSPRSPKGHRLWRKNLRDNDGDGVTAVGDGVDLDRNVAVTWGWDDDGAITTTEDTVFAGFGFEGLARAERDDLVARVMGHLLP